MCTDYLEALYMYLLGTFKMLANLGLGIGAADPLAYLQAVRGILT